MAPRDLLERRQCALVALHRDDPPRPQRQQRARQSAGTGADLDDHGIFERARGARDPRGEVEVQQKILAKRFASRQGMLANDLAKRREGGARRHASRAPAMRAASLSAAHMHYGSGLPITA